MPTNDLILTQDRRRFLSHALLIVALVACLGVSNAQQVRTIRGTVRDENGRGLSGAVVQLEDKTTLRIRSYVTEKDGGYHFAELPTDLSYHLRARYAGVFSERKISSRFDTRKEDVVNLTIHLSK